MSADVKDAVEARAALLRSELERFVAVVSAELRPERIILFGSVAEGKIGEWSDLDLVVVMETELRFLDRMKQVRRLVRPNAGMDVLIYTPREWEHLRRTRPFVREEIVGKGTIIYECPE